jgi:basic membrane protein A
LRKLSMIAATGIALTMALTGCGKSHDDATDGSSTSASKDVCGTSFTGDGPKIGLAFDVGGRGDHSFNDAAYTGMEKAVSDLSASCIEGEAQDGEPESAREDRLTQMADAGATGIVGVGYLYSDAVNAVAPKYPDIDFLVVDGYDPDTDANANVAYASFNANESSFLVGVAAALKTQSKIVGFIGGVHVDLIKSFEAGYTAGVHAVDPSIQVLVNYIEESDPSGYNDPAKAKTLAEGQFDKGADVIYHAAGASGSGLFDAAVEAGDGKWAIGVDSDQYLTATTDQQAHILTSALKRVDTATYDFVEALQQGKPQTGYVTYNLANDGVGYSTSGGFVDDIKSKIDDYAQQIISGAITVPTKP